MRLYPLIRPLAFRLDAERAHRVTIAALKLMPAHRPPDLPASLRIRVAGIDFPTPIGLGAGFDKDAEVPVHDVARSSGASRTQKRGCAWPGNPSCRSRCR